MPLGQFLQGLFQHLPRDTQESSLTYIANGKFMFDNSCLENRSTQAFQTNLNLLDETRRKLLVTYLNSRSLAVLACLGARAVLNAQHLTSVPCINDITHVQLTQRDTQGNLDVGRARLLLTTTTAHSSEPESLKDAERVMRRLIRSFESDEIVVL
jgi:hypothetical protein